MPKSVPVFLQENVQGVCCEVGAQVIEEMHDLRMRNFVEGIKRTFVWLSAPPCASFLGSKESLDS